MIENLKVAHINPEQRVWFVRSDSGWYADHFKFGGLIATGHLSEIFPDDIKELPTLEDVRNKILGDDEYSTFRQKNKDQKATKVFNQKGSKLFNAIDRFYNEISIGDLVITKNASSGFMIGVCSSSSPYFSMDPVDLPNSEIAGDNQSLRLEFTLRKSVIWGPTIPRHEVPESLQNSLARNTITELTVHKQMIYHLLYPFYTDGESLFFSNKIRTTSDINSAVIGKLFQNISLVTPLVAALLAGTAVEADTIIKLAEQSIFSDIILSTSKADFASPGDTWSKIPFSGTIESLPKHVIAVALGCLLVTGAVIVESSSVDQEARSGSQVTEEKSTPFNDKFKDAIPSEPISEIEKSINRHQEAINDLQEKTYVSTIQDSLQLQIVAPNTSTLENFQYGMKVYKTGVE
ncbi:hypothetical protein D3C77_242480 [compost metagenome]